MYKILITATVLSPLICFGQEVSPAPTESQQLILTGMTLLGLLLIGISVRNYISRRKKR